jgi:hypothetical protein
VSLSLSPTSGSVPKGQTAVFEKTERDASEPGPDVGLIQQGVGTHG